MVPMILCRLTNWPKHTEPMITPRLEKSENTKNTMSEIMNALISLLVSEESSAIALAISVGKLFPKGCKILTTLATKINILVIKPIVDSKYQITITIPLESSNCLGVTGRVCVK